MFEIWKNGEMLSNYEITEQNVKHILYLYLQHEPIKCVNMLDNKATFVYRFNGKNGDVYEYKYIDVCF